MLSKSHIEKLSQKNGDRQRERERERERGGGVEREGREERDSYFKDSFDSISD